MKNWQKLRILIVLFQICGNKTLDDGEKKKEFQEEEKESRGCRAIIAPYIIDPLNKYKMTWDLFIGIIYLISYVLDPIVFAFKFQPLESTNIREFSNVVTYILILDILLVPFTGVAKDDNEISIEGKKNKKKKKQDLLQQVQQQSQANVLQRKGKMRRQTQVKDSVGMDDSVLERDIWTLTKKYFKGDAILDLAANLPGMVYIIYLDKAYSSSDLDFLNNDNIFVAFMALKILRLAHQDEV